MLLLAALGAGCYYSMASLRPAEVLQPGEGDFLIGAVSLLCPVFDANLGVAKGLEIGARFEGPSLTFDTQVQIVGVQGEGVDVSLEGGGGFSILPEFDTDVYPTSSYGGARLSGSFGRVTPYLHVRYLWVQRASGEDEVLEVFLGVEIDRRRSWRFLIEIPLAWKVTDPDPDTLVGLNVGLRVRLGGGEEPPQAPEPEALPAARQE